MIFAEIIVLLGLLGALGTIAWTGGEWVRKNDKVRLKRVDQRAQDLREALASRDYHKLDDWLIIYADDMPENVKNHVMIRRDELYLEKNP